MALPPDQLLLRFLLLFGWIPIAAVFLWGIKEIWMTYIQEKWFADQKFTILAIDIPRGNEQSPRAVENIFTYLAGAHGGFNLIEKYWEGRFQLSFSLEVVSINGYSQFLIHTPEIYRNLVESAIYSQYPDAEITEVNDYTESAPNRFPDEEYDMWGAEFTLANSQAYPIKTYEEFIHQMGRPEDQFKDPMATLMDLYASLRPGEQIWFQIVVTPTNFDWTASCDKEISKILGEKPKSKRNIADVIIDMMLGMLSFASDAVYQLGEGSEKKKQEEEVGFKMMNLKPKEKKQIEFIQRKAGKVGFDTKIRFIYLSEKEAMNKPKAINGFVGYIKQFATLDLNNLKPDTKKTGTSANYFFVDSKLRSRKMKMIRAYKSRSASVGLKAKVMNIEELATIWHFPVESVVKAPLIQKSPGRKAEPPMTLPLGEESASAEVYSLKDIRGARRPVSHPVHREAGHLPWAETLRREEEDGRDGPESPDPEPEAEEPGPAAPKPASPKDPGDIFSAPPPEKRGTPPPNLPFA